MDSIKNNSKMNNTSRLEVKSLMTNDISKIEFDLLKWLKENPCNIFEIKYSSCYSENYNILHSVLLFYEKTNNINMKSSSEPDTIEFWEKLFKENAGEKTKDKLHYKKKKVILSRMAELYCKVMAQH